MSMPAVVKFIGNEDEYRLGCDDSCCFYCRDCEKHDTCQKAVQSLFTFAKMYNAFFVEYWQGKRNGLHVQGNDGDIHDFVPLEDFEILSDSDSLLNDYEATVRCITHDYDDGLFGLTYGNNYTAIGKDKDGLFLVMDDSCDCYFYSADYFEIVEDKHGILSRESVYYSFHGENRIPSYYLAAHAHSNNHKPELEQDSKCGCFYCLSIFDPKEINEWIIADNDCDRRGTAICPYCGIDSVIGESSGYPLTEEFLQKMHEQWF